MKNSAQILTVKNEQVQQFTPVLQIFTNFYICKRLHLILSFLYLILVHTYKYDNLR